MRCFSAVSLFSTESLARHESHSSVRRKEKEWFGAVQSLSPWHASRALTVRKLTELSNVLKVT